MKILKQIFSLIPMSIVLTTRIHGQMIFFPKENYSDSAKLVAAISPLARQVKEIYENAEELLLIKWFGSGYLKIPVLTDM